MRGGEFNVFFADFDRGEILHGGPIIIATGRGIIPRSLCDIRARLSMRKPLKTVAAKRDSFSAVF
jgi:hypothetical protein